MNGKDDPGGNRHQLQQQKANSAPGPITAFFRPFSITLT